ncbi:MAG: hypothetical protein LWW91_10940 [Bacteroidales bacterium]|jgi:hypothetical protein|nr:hypothetical protein [Bacteroidales bacterium]
MNEYRNNRYERPEITQVQLDLEISLQLASDVNPMEEPDWTSKAPENFTNDPYQLT